MTPENVAQLIETLTRRQDDFRARSRQRANARDIESMAYADGYVDALTAVLRTVEDLRSV